MKASPECRRRARVYIPDFVLDTGEIVEVKGLSTRVNLWKFHEAVVRYPDYRFILVDKPAYVKLEAEYHHLPGWGEQCLE